MTCLTCFRKPPACECPPPANDNLLWNPDKIWIPADRRLATPSAVRRSAMIYKTKEITRREIPNLVHDSIMGFEGEVSDPYGRLIDHLAIDVDYWFNTDRDPSYRWLSRFLSFSAQVPIQNAQTQVIPRLILLWLAVAIGSRTQAELIIR